MRDATRHACARSLRVFVRCSLADVPRCGGGARADSCVLYLSTQHLDFEGGTFSFNDPPEAPGGPRVMSPLEPTKGAAVIFSSGCVRLATNAIAPVHPAPLVARHARHPLRRAEPLQVGKHARG